MQELPRRGNPISVFLQRGYNVLKRRFEELSQLLTEVQGEHLDIGALPVH